MINNTPTNYKEYLTYLKNKDSKEWHRLYSQAISYLKSAADYGHTVPPNMSEVDIVIYAERKMK